MIHFGKFTNFRDYVVMEYAKLLFSEPGMVAFAFSCGDYEWARNFSKLQAQVMGPSPTADAVPEVRRFLRTTIQVFPRFHWPKALLEGIYYNNHDQRGIVAALLFLDGETTKFGSASAQSRQTERSVLEAKGVDKDLLPILGELKKAQKAGAPKIANTQE